MNEFSREDRYTVIKHSQLTKDQSKYMKDCILGEGIPTVESVVVEYDWPEYHLVWAMLAHRMAGKPVPDFNLWRKACQLESTLARLVQENDLAMPNENYQWMYSPMRVECLKLLENK